MHQFGVTPTAPSEEPEAPAPGSPAGGGRGLLDLHRLPDPEHAAVTLAALQASVVGYLEEAKAANTRRGYRHDMAHFRTWCQSQQLTAVPAEPDTVALYIAALAGQARVATIERRLAAISVAHQMQGLESPTRSSLVRTTMQGIRRRHGSAPRQVTPLRLPVLRRLLAALPEHSAAGVRDRAILLLGFAGGFRTSELAGLDRADLEELEEGLVVHLRRAKTDPAGQGRDVAIPRGRHPETCPVSAVRRWAGVAGAEPGPLFRRIDRRDRVAAAGLRPVAIAAIVQRACARAGLPATEYAGHSLRSGFATEAAAQGASERAIMAQGGWRSVQMARRYIRSGELFTENAAAVLGSEGRRRGPARQAGVRECLETGSRSERVPTGAQEPGNADRLDA